MINISPENFWLVWSPQGRTPPSAKHPTIATARSEASRLAKLNPGNEFYVLTGESLHLKRDVDVFQLQGRGKTDREIPF